MMAEALLWRRLSGSRRSIRQRSTNCRWVLRFCSVCEVCLGEFSKAGVEFLRQIFHVYVRECFKIKDPEVTNAGTRLMWEIATEEGQKTLRLRDGQFDELGSETENGNSLGRSLGVSSTVQRQLYCGHNAVRCSPKRQVLEDCNIALM